VIGHGDAVQTFCLGRGDQIFRLETPSPEKNEWV